MKGKETNKKPGFQCDKGVLSREARNEMSDNGHVTMIMSPSFDTQIAVPLCKIAQVGVIPALEMAFVNRTRFTPDKSGLGQSAEIGHGKHHAASRDSPQTAQYFLGPVHVFENVEASDDIEGLLAELSDGILWGCQLHRLAVSPADRHAFRVEVGALGSHPLLGGEPQGLAASAAIVEKREPRQIAEMTLEQIHTDTLPMILMEVVAVARFIDGFGKMPHERQGVETKRA
jgi:hypothetical protein